MRQPNLSVALAKALRFLAVRPRSIAEVRDRLVRYNLDQPTIESIISHLVETKLLDDLSFAKWWVENKGQSRSKKVLCYELSRKKVSQDIIHEVTKSQNDLTTLRRFLVKKIQQQNLSNSQDKNKLMRLALARGYSYEDIKTVLQYLKSEC